MSMYRVASSLRRDGQPDHSTLTSYFVVGTVPDPAGVRCGDAVVTINGDHLLAAVIHVWF